MADVLRYINLMLAVLVIAFFPLTVYLQGRIWREWFAVAGSEIICLAICMGSLANLDTPFNWRVPLVTLGLWLYCINMALALVRRAFGAEQGGFRASDAGNGHHHAT